KAGLSLSDVLNQLDEIHGRLLDYVRQAPEEQFTVETRFRRRLRLDTYSHYPKHAKTERNWGQKRFAQKRGHEHGCPGDEATYPHRFLPITQVQLNLRATTGMPAA